MSEKENSEKTTVKSSGSGDVKMPLPRSLQEIVGSLLFASPDPLTAGELREAIRALEPEEGESREVMEVYKTCTGREIDAALKGLGKALDVAGCGFELVCTGGTYRLQTSASCGRYVRAMLKMDRPSRIGRASLETLAIIAYRQPITKGEVEQIRGVDVTGNIKTLSDLQLIRLVGKSELPGHPFLYGTTPLFLEHFGLANLQQLNELDPTLQRSNPKLKAEAYKRPVAAPTALEEAAGDEVKVEKQVEGGRLKVEQRIDSDFEEGESGESEEGKVKSEEVRMDSDSEVEEGEKVKEEGQGQERTDSVSEGGETGESEGENGEKMVEDDDDFFIDDTPDELVDDDDDEDEEEEEEEEDGEDGE